MEGKVVKQILFQTAVSGSELINVFTLKLYVLQLFCQLEKGNPGSFRHVGIIHVLKWFTHIDFD